MKKRLIRARFVLVLAVILALFSLMISILYVEEGISRVAVLGSQLTAAIHAPDEPILMADAPARVGGDTRFAMIGDYGAVWSSAPSYTASLVESWEPDFIITVGDNNYPVGAVSTIDLNVGRPYHEFIYPYVGEFGPGAQKKNRFWPALGNHDWDSLSCVGSRCSGPYFDYFTLPNNERYYDFVEGPIHFFVTNSDSREPDGITTGSIQGRWLKERLAASTATWKVVYMHHSPYSSGRHGSLPFRQWPYREWGADVVLSGHDHMYERIMVDEMLYLVNGAGGTTLYNFGEPIEGSQVRYNDSHGAMLVDANEKEMTFQFITQAGEVIDSYTIEPRTRLTPDIAIGELRLPALADSYVLASTPLKSYGSEPLLRIAYEPTSTAYIKFDLSNLTDLDVVSAKLQAWVANDNHAGTRSRPQIKAVGDNDQRWQETTLHYNSQPALGQTMGEIYATRSGDQIEVDLTEWVNNALSGTLTIAIEATSADDLYLHSREALMRQPTLLIEYNGRGSPPVIETLFPAQSLADSLHELDVYGQQFQPNSTVMLDDRSLSTTFINANHLRALIPASYGASLYQVDVSNPDGTQTSTPHSYRLLGLADDDLYGLPHELVAAPHAFKIGQTNQLTLTVHRQGGAETLLDVPVHLYEVNPSGEDHLLGMTSIPTLKPNEITTTIPLTWTPSHFGQSTIYALIDPKNEFAELIENNNQVTRSITVLSASSDQSAPTIDAFTIENGLMDSFDPLLELNIGISNEKDRSQPPSDAQSIFVTEFEYNQATRQWAATQFSGWRPYTNSEQVYWEINPTEGIKHLQIWATDNANNISTAKSAQISYLPPSAKLARDRSHFYVYRLTNKQVITATLTPNHGDPDLYIWSPTENLSWQSINGADEHDQIGFAAPETGHYVIQVHGYEATDYHLDVQITENDGRTNSPRQNKASIGDKIPLTQAGLSPSELPDRLPYALPADVTFKKIYLPVILR